jgi:hypothetical protein
MNTPNFPSYSIYQIKNTTNGLIYIGSTKKKLNKRLSSHKTDYKRYLENKRGYITSFKLFENDNYKNCIISLLETITDKPYNFIKEREQYYIDFYDCVNKINPKSKTDEEKKEYERARHQTEESKLRRRQKIICSCGSEILKVNKLRHLKSLIHINYVEK